MEKKTTLTTSNGAPVADNQNAMTAGARGPMLLQDVWYLEKMAHFDRENVVCMPKAQELMAALQ